MKTVQLTAFGDLSHLVLTDVPTPEPGAGQVLIDVHAASLNPLDSVLRLGHLQGVMPMTLPSTLGGDVAGTVTAVGRDVTAFAPGDRVYGQAYTFLGDSGSFAEQAVVDAGHLDTIPAHLSFVEAASLPVVASTAVHGVRNVLAVGPGRTVLVTGGAGSVGSVAVEVAKHLGARVVATASGAGLDLATRLGADQVVDHRTGSLAGVHDVDAVFDTVGGDALLATFRVLRRGGTAVTIAGQDHPEEAAAAGVTVHVQQAQAPGTLAVVSQLVTEGVIHPRVARTFPLADAADAFAARESGAVKGKIVLVVRD